MTGTRLFCARCLKRLSAQRRQAKKKYCYPCERAVRRERLDKAHDAYVCKTYGLQPGDYQRLYDAQNGRCFICLRATGKTRRLAVDHDHKTGLVRGLLCKPCNRMLGHARDDGNVFLRAYSYLIFPPAREVVYRQATDNQSIAALRS